MNFQNWLSKAIKLLFKSENPSRDAETLLEFVTGKTRTFLFAFGETKLTIEQEIKLDILLKRRILGEPLAYLIGESEFWSLPLYVSSATLIPRPDTECLVEQALICLKNKNNSSILDLGTGTGAIALAIANERPDCRITAIDLIPDVVFLAKRNAKRLAINNINIIQSNWFNSLNNQRFDIIVSNPPYIDPLDFPFLKGDVKFEPISAILSGNKGMADLNYIITNSHKYLHKNGWLIVEHSWNFGKNVRDCFLTSGFKNIETVLDYSGNERLTIGKIT